MLKNFKNDFSNLPKIKNANLINHLMKIVRTKATEIGAGGCYESSPL
uniref:Uncharacterized protein n=1 Tax=Nelumbo nucifera TaxID=4432 RepID=A0A822ZQR9_NELNU|nr:TPA_asm: hypothetical protein HUJ06_004081 [Nelumbo nucifera]